MARTWRLVSVFCITDYSRGRFGSSGAGLEPRGDLHGQPQCAAIVLLGAGIGPRQGSAPVKSRKHERPFVRPGGQPGGAPPHQSAPRWQALSGQHVACSAPSSFRRMRNWTSDALALGADPRAARTRTDRMAANAGRVTAIGPCSEPSGSTDHPSRPGGQHERTPVVGNRRILRKNQRSLAESFRQSDHTMFRTPVPATFRASSLTRRRRRSGLYDQRTLASPFRPFTGSRVTWNRVPSRVTESPFPKRRAKSARGL